MGLSTLFFQRTSFVLLGGYGPGLQRVWQQLWPKKEVKEKTLF
jgi:hypothetical protein